KCGKTFPDPPQGDTPMIPLRTRFPGLLPALALLGLTLPARAADKLETVAVEGQPLAANARRLLQALDFLGAPLPRDTAADLQKAIKARDARKIQKLLDPHVLVQVSLSPEARVKAARGPAAAAIQQHGFTPVLLKVVNESTVKKALNVR